MRYEMDISISQTDKLRFRKFKSFSQAYAANKW